MSDRFPSNIRGQARAIESGNLRSEQLVGDCLEKAMGREGELRAWAYLGCDEALKEARQRDQQPRLGPLHGIPIAIKDLSDTATMPTSYGSPAYSGNRPVMDAACVALARTAGAVILGKTATVEFGATRPCATVNPHNSLHTPGGSSAGSAAVVADGQVLLATGTQTGGSIIRPAAYCGAVGFKPSFGALSPSGTKCYAWSLDTLGLFAACVSDASLFFDVLRGETEPMPLAEGVASPRIGIFPGPFAERADSSAVLALERVASQCSLAGASIRAVSAVAGFEHSLDWQRTISRYEMGRSMTPERQARSTELGPVLLREIEDGRSVHNAHYLSAKASAAELSRRVDVLLADHDVLLTLATPGEAPAGLGSTGDATFNLSWSLLGLPCLSLPVALGPNRLPLAVQLIGARHGERVLLSVAAWIEEFFSNPCLLP